MSVFCRLTNEDGNAFAVLGRVARALKQAGVADEEIEKYRADAKCGDFDHLLRVSIEILEDKGIAYE